MNPREYKTRGKVAINDKRNKFEVKFGHLCFGAFFVYKNQLQQKIDTLESVNLATGLKLLHNQDSIVESVNVEINITD